MQFSKETMLLIGGLAIVGALGGILADALSVWSGSPNSMNTAISIDIKSIEGLFLGKPRWSYIAGTYVGVFVIPFHMFGFYLIYQATLPAGKKLSTAFLVVSIYIVSIGAGFHGTLAFLGDIINSGERQLIEKVFEYWHVWGGVLIIGYLVVSACLAGLIVSGRTIYRRSAVLLSPLVLLLLSTILIALLPENLDGLKKFLAVTGLNLPLLVFYLVTIITLLNRFDSEVVTKPRVIDDHV